MKRQALIFPPSYLLSRFFFFVVSVVALDVLRGVRRRPQMLAGMFSPTAREDGGISPVELIGEHLIDRQVRGSMFGRRRPCMT